MHIIIHMYPNHFPQDPKHWKIAMANTHVKIAEHLNKAIVSPTAATLGETSLLDHDGKIVANVAISKT